MVPHIEIEVDASIPPGAAFWVPDPDEIDEEEGFGGFREVWKIVGETVSDAAAVASAESAAADYVDQHARDSAEFELLAEYIETVGGDDDYADDPDDGIDISSTGAPQFAPAADGSWIGLQGLELGVAGLVYALSSAGFYPAASCRSHNNTCSWSECPVVIFAADRARVEWLQPLVEQAGCGFSIDPNRGRLLCITAPSIWETMHLAQLILASHPHDIASKIGWADSLDTHESD